MQKCVALITGFLLEGLVLISGVAGQADSTKAPAHYFFGLETGVCNFASIDEIFSSERFEGKNLIYGAHFYSSARKWQQRVSIQFSQMERKPAGIPATASYYLHDTRYQQMRTYLALVEYAMLRKIRWNPSHIGISAGGMFRSFANISRSTEVVPEIVSISLSPELYVSRSWKKHNVFVESWLTLIGLVMRNTYYNNMPQDYGNPMSQLEFVSKSLMVMFPDHFTELCAAAGYKWQMSPSVQIGFSYSFWYQRVTEPRSLQAVSGTYNLGIFYSPLP